MANITYSLGGTSFDAVPEEMVDKSEAAVRSDATLGRGILHTVGVGKGRIVLKGKYMTVGVRSAILVLHENCVETGTSVVFNDGYTDRNVLIEGFGTVPIVGKTEGYGFRIELVVV